MTKEIAHIGINVTDILRSIEFYGSIGFRFTGGAEMQGEEASRLFGLEEVSLKLAYMSPEGNLSSPPLELLEFDTPKSEKDATSFLRTGISEVCFSVEDIDEFYKKVTGLGADVLSTPVDFDFTSYGMGRSRAFYFRDPDGNMLEAIEYIR